MFSALENMVGKSPTSISKKTRQVTLERAFSNASNRKTSNESKDSPSTPPSMTTGSSNADNSSEINYDTTRQEESQGDPARGQALIDSDNDLSISAEPVASNSILTKGQSGLPTPFIPCATPELDSAWGMRLEMPPYTSPPQSAESAKASEAPVAPAPRRESTRRKMLDKANTAVERSTRVLGKRARETVEVAKEQAAAVYGLEGSRLRNKKPASQPTPVEGPASKKTRFSVPKQKETSPEPVAPKKKMQKPTKNWVEHGLYVGQDRDFDPRLTEAKNKKKIALKSTGQKPFMPLPMYSGQKALENGRNFRLPFEVFSPLPPGQPKPDEWKKTQKNVFIGDAAAVWKKGKKLEDSVCDCKPEDGCDEQCFNRSMLYECDEKNCNLGKDSCTNRSFSDLKERLKAGGKYNVGVEVLKTADRGYGIRANRQFAPNQIIVEYTGEIITKEECDSRMRGRYKDAECYYLMDFDQSMILDATRGSIARFVNHSCSPNCRMAKWTVQGVPRMALFAGDNGIMTGEELTYDYNFNPFSVKNIQECRCGSDNCRGVLGPKPKEAKEREIREALNPIAGGGKRKYQQMAEDAFEGAKNLIKKPKLDIPIPTSIKATMMRSQLGITGSSFLQTKNKANEKETPKAKGTQKPQGKGAQKPQSKGTPKPQGKGSQKPKGKEIQKPAGKETPKPQSNGVQKAKKSTKPKLPPGWIYTDDMAGPAPPLVRNVFAHDPEALLRSRKRRAKQESEGNGAAAQKKRKTTSDDTLVEQDAGQQTSDEVENRLDGDDNGADAQPDDSEEPSLGGKSTLIANVRSIKDNIVRTMKGRQGNATPGTSGGEKSIRVVEDEEEVDGDVDEEIE